MKCTTGKSLVVGTAGAVAQAATAYSQSDNMQYGLGISAALISSTAGSITVTLQASVDNSTFYDVVDENGASLGAVVSAMTVGTKYIVFPTLLAPFVRFKVVENNSAATVVTIQLMNLID